MSQVKQYVVPCAWVLCILAYISIFSACRKQIIRPNNVPIGAVYIKGPHGAGVWHACQMTSYSTDVKCQIYNINGSIIIDDIFVVYSGQAPRTTNDLNISLDGGDEYIKLKNGTILISRKDEAKLRDGLDWLFGKKKARVE